MPKIAIWNNQHYFMPDSGMIIIPNKKPDEIIDLTYADKKDIEKLKDKPDDKKTLEKIKNNLPGRVQ